ncbi:hypothetical protein [Sulfurovum sp. NBC37-1]|uniref:hypothetical protein n=1 Tax=Sulfurovum sp. (strain NBC37-1) TaxID=387093 RepID=UPI00015879AC|nr:hypothetical protein [Sulfurovum sp. NBC37-1]BAF72958.1 hypothetical protein SUN_2016 [Sulfurovum sp. NBC37-1]
MKKTVLFLVVTLTLAVSAENLSGYKYLDFQIGINSKYVQKYVLGAKKLGMHSMVDTKLRCKDAGFTKKDSIAEGVMYGKKRADGSIDVSGVGDFKMYRYARYMKNGKECIETHYFKDDPSFGKRSFLMMNKGS